MVECRLIKESEINELLKMIKELGEYLKDDIEMDEQTLHHAIFNDHSCHAYIVFNDHIPLGYALFYYTFSTMTGKRGIYLLDLYVRDNARGLGLGKALFKALSTHAIENDCCRIDWDCLKWNKGSIEFYHSLDATVRDDHDFFRLELPQLHKIKDEA